MRIFDPSDRDILLPDNLHVQQAENDPPAHLLIGDYQRVIETPACIIELSPEHIFYFRSVEWNVTVLIEVILQKEQWIAVNCLKNPSVAFIMDLLREGRFIAGSALG